MMIRSCSKSKVLPWSVDSTARRPMFSPSVVLTQWWCVVAFVVRMVRPQRTCKRSGSPRGQPLSDDDVPRWMCDRKTHGEGEQHAAVIEVEVSRVELAARAERLVIIVVAGALVVRRPRERRAFAPDGTGSAVERLALVLCTRAG